MEGDELVGASVAHLNVWTSEPHVGHVSTTIRSDRRRRGIGSMLYALAEEHAVGLGARKLFAWLVETTEALLRGAARLAGAPLRRLLARGSGERWISHDSTASRPV